MKVIIILNTAAGSLSSARAADRKRSLAEAFSAAGIEAEIPSITGGNLDHEAKTAAASAVDVVVACGGDGTISSVARALVGTAMPLGIVPLGTLNHFAKDLKIPLDVAAAVQVIAAGRVSRIDVGDVNGRVFINNSSLGVYPHFVLNRDSQRQRHGLSKWAAMLPAVLNVFRRFPMVHLRLATDAKTIERKTPLVFIGNNDYQFDLFNFGQRNRLDCGELSLSIAKVHTRWGLFKLTMRSLAGCSDRARDVETFHASSCLIETRRHRLPIALDGEVIHLLPPLHYCIRPAALSVCVPDNPANCYAEAATG
ncbi:MAG: NAD(+)/NADH kinase [Planctomycetaceae bacterium]|nr:NAD(+)/NADH kinase [Planctomycetaceae bacterium]